MGFDIAQLAFARLTQVTGQALLAGLQLLEEVREELSHRFVAGAALHGVHDLVGSEHYLHPRLVDVLERSSRRWRRQESRSYSR